MSPVTRRQSMRLAELADKDAEIEKPAPKQQPLSKRDNVISAVGGGRVTKPEPKGRVVSSRYMSAANPRKLEPTTNVGTKPAPANTVTGARARAGSVSSATGTGTIGTNRGKTTAAAAPRPVSRMASTSARRAAPIAAATATSA
ncbi:hypothetical protein H4S07_002326, partial [Coemansia furcata]